MKSIRNKKMVLAIDVGNSNIVFGFFKEKQKCQMVGRITTPKNATYQELGFLIQGILKREIDTDLIKKGIYSSVVPSFNIVIEKMCQNYFNFSPLCVSSKLCFPFSISYPNPNEIGSDRLVNAAAVVQKYQVPAIVIDMGTATTFCVVNEKKEYIGGLIAPGLEVSKNSLIQKTAQLPDIDFLIPEKIIGETTVSSLQAGFFYSWVGIFREIIFQIKSKYGSDYQVIGTGGFINNINRFIPDIFNHVDADLTLEGLRIIYELNLKK